MVGRTTKALIYIGAALLVGACAEPVAESPAGEPCEAANFVITDSFEGARRGICRVYADGQVAIHIEPEDEGPINSSPWYAFKIEPNGAVEASITINYDGVKHRYWPKTSADGVHWDRLAESDVDISFMSRSASLRISLGSEPLLVAAQEIILPQNVEEWVDAQSSHDQVTQSVLGVSSEGREILKLDINPESKDVVFLLGRQHPPEVSGSFGFRGFYKAILAESELATSFRDRFHIVAIPMLNPDGVVAGNWRHNTGGADLNRDWGPFTQAETRLMNELLNAFDDAGKKVRLFTDFHSTAGNVMYTHSEAEPTTPLDFADRWIAAALPRLSNYEFVQEVRPFSDQANSRNYMYERYGIPSVTFEVGDEQDRETAVIAAGVFAEEMMRLLVDNKQDQ